MTAPERHAEARRLLLREGSLTAAGQAMGISRQSAAALVEASRTTAPLAVRVGLISPPADADKRDLDAILVALRRVLEEAGVTVLRKPDART